MQISLLSANAAAAATDVLAVAVFTDSLNKNPLAQALDKTLGGALFAAAKEQDFKGKSKSRLSMHTLGKCGAKRVLLLGLGDAKKLDAAAYLNTAGNARRFGDECGAKSVLLSLPQEAVSDAEQFELLSRGAYLGGYTYNRYKSDSGRKPSVSKFVVDSHGKTGAAFNAALKQGKITAEGVAAARDLVNDSPLDLYPESFAARASAMAKKQGLKIKVMQPAELKKMKMGLLLGVGAGSTRTPRLVHISYTPAKAAKNAKPVVLVGKGITFDSGGLDLKPPPSMLDMKVDMSGAAAVFGAMQAVAQLKPKFPVHGLLALAENMPSGSAIRPGDVLHSAAGKTVEVNNTDAEGRLVLADALNYALGLKPKRIIDLATLTGACMVALGPYTVGLFSNNDDLADDILESAKAGGEDFWRMPLTPVLKEQLKSDVADTKNTGERWGGAITAGLFLQDFVADTPWAHLDIAGPASISKNGGIFSKGGTGVGVATLVRLLTR